MHVTFDIPVILRARPGRAVNEKTVFGYEPIAVDVPELSDVDAPVVLRYTNLGMRGVEFEEEFRGYNGSFYHHIGVQSAARISFPFRKQRLDDGLFDVQMTAMAAEVDRVSKSWSNEAVKHMAPSTFADAVRRRLMDCPLEPIIGMDLKGDYEASLRNQVDAFRRQISGIVIIDGRFHLPEDEPLLGLNLLPAAGMESRVIRAVDRYKADVMTVRGMALSALGYFRFDEVQNMRAEAARLTNGNGARDTVPTMEMLDQSFFSTDTDLVTLIGLGTMMKQRFAASLVSHDFNDDEQIGRVADLLYKLPTGHLSLYQSLVDGLEDAKQDGCADKLESAISDVLNLSEDQRQNFVYSQTLGYYAHNILRRWTDREVRFDGALLDSPMMP
jgi:hypothetical protein